MKKDLRITSFDLNKKPIIVFDVFGFYEDKLSFLKEYIFIRPFDEGWVRLFEKKVRDRFMKLGATGVSPFEIPEGELQDSNIGSWNFLVKREWNDINTNI